jgi:hypothetical protein
MLSDRRFQRLATDIDDLRWQQALRLARAQPGDFAQVLLAHAPPGPTPGSVVMDLDALETHELWALARLDHPWWKKLYQCIKY